MRIAIIYASETGTTAECIQILREKIKNHEVNVFDVEKEQPNSLADYDAIVVGGPVRYGKLQKAIRAYIRANADVLENKSTVYFVCCAYADRTDEYFEDNLTKKQLKNAVATVNFGGTLKTEKQKNPIMRMAVRRMRNEIIEAGESDDEYESRILPEINTTEISKTADIITGRGKYRKTE